MAFKRSAVRSRLSPPQEAKAENRGFHLKSTVFSAFCLFETGGQEAFPAPCDVFRRGENACYWKLKLSWAELTAQVRLLKRSKGKCRRHFSRRSGKATVHLQNTESPYAYSSAALSVAHSTPTGGERGGARRDSEPEHDQQRGTAGSRFQRTRRGHL